MGEALIEIVDVSDERVTAFLKKTEREALSTFYGFRVVWHEQVHQLAAERDGVVIGGLRARISASLATVDGLAVDRAHRGLGAGSALLERLREVAIYYNCHKITVEVPHKSGAQQFFEHNGYKVEAVLPQHTFKLDMAVMRKFLL